MVQGLSIWDSDLFNDAYGLTFAFFEREIPSKKFLDAEHLPVEGPIEGAILAVRVIQSIESSFLLPQEA